MAGKYGSASAWVFLDGYDITAADIKTLRHKSTSEMEDTTGIKDAARTRDPVGLVDAEVAQEGAYFDTATDSLHDAIIAEGGGVDSDPQGDERVLMWGYAGQAAGVPFFGAQGAFTGEYGLVGEVGALTRADPVYHVKGLIEEGVLIQEETTESADWNTQGASIDNGASSPDGGVGYMAVSAYSGFDSFDGKLEDSPDDAAWADLITFTQITGGPDAERLEVAGTINQFVAFNGDVTGTGSITVTCGLVRN